MPLMRSVENKRGDLLALLEVTNLSITDIRTKDVIVDNINFKLERNRCLGIVGESGSGKSMTVKGILRLIAPWLQISGSAYFKGTDILEMKAKSIRNIRGKHIYMIPQDAMSAFDPLFTIGNQMNETLCENLGISKKEAIQLSLNELERLGIKEATQVLKNYPHQLSGGMLQRCIIAMAIAIKPDIIIADEPTTALDSINQSSVIQAFQKLKSQLGIAVIFITHDLGVIQQLAQDVLVMKDGKQVEYGKAADVFHYPKDKYTKYLVNTRIQLTQSFERAMRKDNTHA